MDDNSLSEMNDLLSVTAGTASGALRGARMRGTAGALTSGLSAAGEIASTGKLSRQSMLGTSAGAAAMVGARLIPGIGWGLMAYTAADMGSRALLGKPFGETMVGKPIDWVAGQAGRAGLSAASGLTDIVGWKSGTEFLNNVVKPWAFPNDGVAGSSFLTPEQRTKQGIEAARESGLLPKETAAPILVKGPASQMNALDTYEHEPSRSGYKAPPGQSHVRMATDAPGSELTTVNPPQSDVTHRRGLAMQQDASTIAGVGHDVDIGLSAPGQATPNKTSAILAAAADQNAAPPVIPMAKAFHTATRDQGSGIDD